MLSLAQRVLGRPSDADDVVHGNEASIKEGLTPGELVVVDGADKPREGSKVDLQTASTDRRVGL